MSVDHRPVFKKWPMCVKHAFVLAMGHHMRIEKVNAIKCEHKNTKCHVFFM